MFLTRRRALESQPSDTCRFLRLVLCLLAFAFARPSPPAATGPVEPGKRVVLLLDTSASMRRAGIWARATDEARSALTSVGPADRLCVMSFDQSVRTLLGFEQGETMDPARRASVATEEISRLSPRWASTDLGHALMAAAEALEDDEANDGEQSRRASRIVLVSDLQQGSKLDALLAYEWPQRTELVVRTIPCQDATNASLQWVASRDPPPRHAAMVRPRSVSRTRLTRGMIAPTPRATTPGRPEVLRRPRAVWMPGPVQSTGRREASPDRRRP
jgi:hypothetical protein